jgi:rod shape-determining protein MreB
MMVKVKLSPQIAIDFGSQTIRAVSDSTSDHVFTDAATLVRNVVSGEIVAIGEAAEEHILAPGEERVNPVQNGIMVDYKGATALLSHAMNHILSWWHIFKPHVVISESLELSSALSQALGEVVQEAGGGRVYMTSVPSLAALGASIDPRDSSGNFILDIGAGTTEAAIVSRGSAVSAISAPVGGNDLIDSLILYLEDRDNVNVSRSAAADIIKSAGSALRRDNDTVHEFYANASETGEAKVLSITGNEITEVIQKPLQRIVSIASSAIRRTPTALLSDIAQNGITITGGVGNLYHIDTYLKREMAVPVRVIDTPENAVITGGQKALQFVSRFEQTVPQSTT